MLDKILQYQQLDGQIKAIETELANTEERKSDVADIVIKYNTIKEQYDANSSLLNEYRQAVDHVIDEDELNYLAKKYEDLVKVIANIEKELQKASQEVVVISKAFDECRTKLPSVKKQYADAKEKFDAKRKLKEPEISAIQRQKAELEKQISHKILKRYKEIKEQNITRPFVVLEEPNRCGGCRMELPMGKLSALETEGYIVCESCHRVIYKANKD